MTFVVIDCVQRSDEWRAARLGKLTGSAAADMMSRIKSGESAGRRKLRIRLALERLTGRSQESAFTSAAMQHGIDTEPVAIREYEARTGNILEPVGFCDVPGLMAGCSPDAFVDDRKGLVSIKCPESHTHYEYLKTRKIPGDYRWQNIHEMWITGAEFVDTVSFDDRFEERLQYICMRQLRDDAEIAAYDYEARAFLAEVSVDIKEMKELQL
jgi:YqaJ-like viral recombinase domain